ncbi:MAG: hypothetical protein ACOC8B_01835 [Gemmatimonadota bacterium]
MGDRPRARRAHELVPRGIRIKNQKTLWGSCGKDGVLRLDRHEVALARIGLTPRPAAQ